MSRLCRLKTASHGGDGKWAYNEIVSQRMQIESLTAQVGVLKEAAQMAVEMIETNAYERRHVRWKLNDAIANTPESALSEVRKAERERCAKVCEELRHPDGYSGENVDCQAYAEKTISPLQQKKP